MATMSGITGKLSGKFGSAVFRVRGGTQVMAQYNPKVANPNTEGQQAQRAAFKLMSQLASIMKGSFIIKVRKEGTKRLSASNAFVKANFPLVEVDTNPLDPQVTAKVQMERLQLTDSLTQFGTIQATQIEGVKQIEVIVTGLPSLGAGSKSAKMILVGYEVLGNGLTRAYVHSEVDVPQDPNANTFTIRFEDLEPGRYTVLSYGMLERIAGGRVRVDYDNIHTPQDDNYISAVIINQATQSGEMDVTNTIGTNVQVVE